MKARFYTIVGLAVGLLVGVTATVQAQDLSFLTNGLVAYYPLNGDAKDYSGYGNDGTLMNAPAAPDRFGMPGGAVHFNGIDGHAQIPQSPQWEWLEATNEVTISTWIWFGTTEPIWMNAIYVCKYDTRDDGGWELVADPSGGGFATYDPWPDNIQGYYFGFGTLQQDRWIQLVVTWSQLGERVCFYLNGELLVAHPASGFHLDPTLGPAYLCHSPIGPDEFRPALMEDLRVYSRALSETEVRNLYEFESNANLTDTAPIIVGQPMGQNMHVGDTAELTVEARGTWPLTYQWFKGEAEVEGATNSTLVLSNVSVATTGDYMVVVANAFGAVTSAVARVEATTRTFPYVADFEGTVEREWSHRQMDVTPIGNRRFLGQFGNDTVSLTLNNLPPHQAVTVSFDLYVIETWDGNDDPDGGPDIWNLSVADGPTLLHTTFLIWPWWGDAAKQAFPSDYPGGAYPARTGAVENDTLGYGWIGDSVYSLTFTFPHDADGVRFDFSGQGLEGVADEGWGLDNVRVDLTPASDVPYVVTSVQPAGTWLPMNNLPVTGVSASGSRALAVMGEAEVRFLDISNAAAPVALGSWSTFLPLSDAVLIGNLAYLASWEADFLSTVEIVDFTDPARPVLRGFYDTAGYAQDLVVRGNIAYLADAEAGLLTLDVGDPTWPWRLGGYETKGSVDHLEVYGRYAYMPDSNWLVILDVSNPYNPRRVGLYEVAGGISSLKAYGSKLYLSEATGDLRILDVSNPASIQLLGTYQGWGNPARAMAASGRCLYLAKGSGGLHVVDVSDPAKPTWLTSAWTSPAEDVALMGNHILAAGGDKGLLVYEVREHLYPPFKPPVISDGTMTLTWATTSDIRLQKATNLLDAVWLDVPESEGTNTVTLPMTEPTAFFRLVQGPKQGQQVHPPDGLIAWWSGDGDALDLVGSNHGTRMNGSTFAAGKVGQAFSFDGVDDYLEVPFLVGGLMEGTVELWFNLATWDYSSAPDGIYLWACVEWLPQGPASWDGMNLGTHPQGGMSATGELMFGIFVEGWLWAYSGVTPDLSTWYHVAGTWGSTGIRIYVDGQLKGANDYTGTLTSNFVHNVVGSSSWPQSAIQGRVDELSLYNRALTDAEIKAIYDAGSAGKLKPTR